MIRIISGSRKGMRLVVPKGSKTRPTADRVKETMFDILGLRVVGAHVLDLYAGSGALGLEALSRGAERVVFVDMDSASIRALKTNVIKTSFLKQTEILRRRLPDLSFLYDDMKGFDLIFMDPPYSRDLVAPTLWALEKAEILKPDGTIVVEHASMEELPSDLKNFKPFRKKDFKELRLTFMHAG